MEVYKKGEGEPEFTITGSIHGDEPVGKKAIEKIIEKDLEFLKPVQFIIANEEALEADKRFVEVDLNRSFPGFLESEIKEERLAAQLLDQIGDSKVLDIHSTHSFDRPFATTKSFENPRMEMLKASGVENAVKFTEDAGTLTDFVEGIVVESGLQHSDQAVENAVEVIENFLAYFEVIDAEFEASSPSKFIETGKVEGNWEFLTENFQKVEKGKVYAKNDEEELAAEEAFYPVLMSTDGYEGMLGHKARKIE